MRCQTVTCHKRPGTAAKKGLTFDREGAPTSGLAFACKPGSMAARGKTPTLLICSSSGTRILF